MCHVLYMASDKERPLVAWDDAQRGFHVTPWDQGALPHLTKPHLRYLGSDQGCGCGFQHAALSWTEDEEHRSSVRKNQQGLARYLAACLMDEESIELFTCWNGDETQPLKRRREIRVADLLEDEFEFEEKEVVVVRA
jgi:hypothetical protein